MYSHLIFRTSGHFCFIIFFPFILGTIYVSARFSYWQPLQSVVFVLLLVTAWSQLGGDLSPATWRMWKVRAVTPNNLQHAALGLQSAQHQRDMSPFSSLPPHTGKIHPCISTPRQFTLLLCSVASFQCEKEHLLSLYICTQWNIEGHGKRELMAEH